MVRRHWLQAIATVVQVLFYCMFYFTCDRSLNGRSQKHLVTAEEASDVVDVYVDGVPCELSVSGVDWVGDVTNIAHHRHRDCRSHATNRKHWFRALRIGEMAIGQRKPHRQPQRRLGLYHDSRHDTIWYHILHMKTDRNCQFNLEHAAHELKNVNNN